MKGLSRSLFTCLLDSCEGVWVIVLSLIFNLLSLVVQHVHSCPPEVKI